MTISRIFKISSMLLILSSLVFASFVFAKGQKEKESEETAEEAQILKMGFAFDLTGPGAEWFNPFAQALEMEIEETNKKGGIDVGGEKYLIKLIKEDTKFTAEGAKAAAEKLVYREKVKYIWGAGIIHTSMALQDVTLPNKVLNLSAGWGKEVLSGKEEPGQPATPYEYTIRIVAGSRQTTPGMWKWVKENYPNAKKVAHITIDTIASHYAVEEVALKLLPSLGFEPIHQEYYEPGMTDFYPLLSKILAKEPDVIQCTNSPPNEWSLIIKQSREMGYEGLFFREEMASADLFTIAGKENCEGLIGWDYPVFGDYAVPELLDFKKRFSDKYGKWIQYSLVPVRLYPPLIQAIQMAGDVDNVERVLELLTTETFNTYGQELRMGGGEYYGVPNMSATPLVITQVQNGEFVPVGTITIEDQLAPWD